LAASGWNLELESETLVLCGISNSEFTFSCL
jgi:hypothetical protein